MIKLKRFNNDRHKCFTLHPFKFVSCLFVLDRSFKIGDTLNKGYD